EPSRRPEPAERGLTRLPGRLGDAVHFHAIARGQDHDLAERAARTEVWQDLPHGPLRDRQLLPKVHRGGRVAQADHHQRSDHREGSHAMAITATTDTPRRASGKAHTPWRP